MVTLYYFQFIIVFLLRRDELRLAVALSRCPFNNSDPVQLQILQTIYKQLTGDIFDCPRCALRSLLY